MASSRVYVPSASEQKCRICSSASARAEVERLLGRLGETDPVIGKVTLAGIVALFERMDGRSISLSSLKRHRAKHVSTAKAPSDGEVPSPEWEQDSEMQALIEEMGELAKSVRLAPSALLDLQSRMWLIQTRRKLAAGVPVPISS